MKTSALVLLKTLENLWYSEGTLERLEASVSFAELAWMSKEQRQSLKLWEPRSFDVCKNAVVLMIVILCCLELDTEVSGAGIKTEESNNCRGMLRIDGDTNSVLAVIWEETRFSYKDG